MEISYKPRTLELFFAIFRGCYTLEFIQQYGYTEINRYLLFNRSPFYSTKDQPTALGTHRTQICH